MLPLFSLVHWFEVVFFSVGKIKLSAFVSQLGHAVGSPCIKGEDIERLSIYAASNLAPVHKMDVLVKFKKILKVMKGLKVIEIMASRCWRNVVRAEEACKSLKRVIERYYGMVKKQDQEFRAPRVRVVWAEKLGCCRAGHNGAGEPVYQS